MSSRMWNDEEPVKSREIEVPEWIEQDTNGSTVAAIIQGGCSSGAYMPAVTYYQAVETMSKHGDDVLQYIEDQLGELPTPSSSESWGGIAVHYLSSAVELWAHHAAELLEEFYDLTELEEG